MKIVIEQPHTRTRHRGWVLTNPNLGVYLGTFNRIPVWSNASPLRIIYAPVFDTVFEAMDEVPKIVGFHLWDIENDVLEVAEVETWRKGYADGEECLRCGLPGWVASLTFDKIQALEN